MLRRRGLDSLLLAVVWLATVWWSITAEAVSPDTVVLHLKSGDRVSGTIISDEPGYIVVSNRWARQLSIPRDEIIGSDLALALSPVIPGKTNVNAADRLLAKTSRWKGEAQVGVDLLYGGKGRQTYYGRFKLGYERPYQSDPKQHFRNGIDVAGEYGRTDGVKSSDRLNGSDKTSFDISRDWYIYNLAGMGYDHILKIDLQYEEGPGLGYHLFQKPTFNMNLESGANYQVQERDDSPDVRDFYYRLAQELTWKINDRLALTDKLEIFPRVDLNEYRARFESTLAYCLWKNIALNLSVMDLYDSAPADDVNHNEFQIRSSLGVKF
jgi:hypothetical protein